MQKGDAKVIQNWEKSKKQKDFLSGFQKNRTFALAITLLGRENMVVLLPPYISFSD
jgi:hypothetical protein